MALFQTAILYDVYANIPSDNSSLTTGRLFFSSDTHALYRDNGSSWDSMTVGAASGAASAITYTPTAPLTGTDVQGGLDEAAAFLASLGVAHKFFQGYSLSAYAYSSDGSASGFASASGENAIEMNNTQDFVVKDIGTLTDGDSHLKAPDDGIYHLEVAVPVYCVPSGSTSGAVCSNVNLYNSDNSLNRIIDHRYWPDPTVGGAFESFIYSGDFYLTAGQYLEVTIINDSGINVTACFRSLTWRQVLAATL